MECAIQLGKIIMSFATKTAALTMIGVIVSGTAALAQAGGSDVPSNAKNQGEKEIPGSTGKASSGGAMKAAPSASENKPSATGGQSGGGANQQ